VLRQIKAIRRAEWDDVRHSVVAHNLRSPQGGQW
jgi:hypothetical protein